MWAYSFTVEPDDNGTLLVSFPSIPEAHTFADDENQVRRRATDCVLTALEGYMRDGRPLPVPTRGSIGRAVQLPPEVIARIELYEGMRNSRG